MRSRAQTLLDKSLAAMISAIEIYNKPDFKYREETFSILATNAWELLLKARLLQIAQNRIGVILEYEHRRKADGSFTDKLYRKMNRSGTHVSIGLFRAYDILVNGYHDRINPTIRRNLELLVEIRDNAVHFMNKSFELERRVQEIGSACLRNYLNIVRQWFGRDLSQFNFFLMPLSFIRDFHTMDIVALNGEEKKLLRYLTEQIVNDNNDPSADYSLALRLEIHLVKAGANAEVTLGASRDAGTIPILLEEESIRQAYPWTYDILTARLQKRYTDFKVNSKYHEIRKGLEGDERFCKIRLLDPGNPRSGQKKFYNPNIVREFDHHYTRGSVPI